ncbi:hypothetical protein P5704_024670 (plasmid) [Pseudomonas sp. FeN3W]|nr:hypothetical protein P5704_024670 [Pseudomonas sp. FeN3W]
MTLPDDTIVYVDIQMSDEQAVELLQLIRSLREKHPNLVSVFDAIEREATMSLEYNATCIPGTMKKRTGLH